VRDYLEEDAGLPAGERLRMTVFIGIDGEPHVRVDPLSGTVDPDHLEMIEGAASRMLARVHRGRPPVPAGEEP